MIEPWAWAALGAATAQTARFALQKRVAVGLGAVGATYARFVWSAPLALLAALALVLAGEALPPMPPAFWAWAALGGLAQIGATLAVVALFALRHFAVGITLKKTEVILTALAGWILLGETLPPPALAALAVGLAGVLLLADPPGASGPLRARVLSRSAGLGLLSGLLFALSAVAYRAATLELATSTAMRAALALAVVTAMQAAAMTLWLALRDRATLRATLRRWRATVPIGVASALGSLGWFAAFSMQSAALVFAVGQVELILSLALGRLMFSERPGRRELLGVALVGASVVTVALVG